MLDWENYHGKFPQGIVLVEHFLKGVAQLRHLVYTQSLASTVAVEKTLDKVKILWHVKDVWFVIFKHRKTSRRCQFCSCSWRFSELSNLLWEFYNPNKMIYVFELLLLFSKIFLQDLTWERHRHQVVIYKFIAIFYTEILLDEKKVNLWYFFFMKK